MDSRRAAVVPEAKSKRPATGFATVPSRPFPTPVMNPCGQGGLGKGGGERGLRKGGGEGIEKGRGRGERELRKGGGGGEGIEKGRRGREN